MRSQSNIAACWLLMLLVQDQTLVAADVELIATGQLPGTAGDLSGLNEPLTPEIPHARLGGFSALDYSGAGTRYYTLSDRGPHDGAVPYRCRFHTLNVELPALHIAGQIGELQISLVETRLLTTERGRPLIGLAAAFHAHRFDPEGFRASVDGRLFVSDEYGPAILEFSGQGSTVRSFPLHDRYRIEQPSESKDAEARLNSSGRQPNRGLEGLAVSPDGRRLLAIMQGPLLQDSRPTSETKRSGVNVRALEIEIETGTTREFVYQLDDDSHGVSEILAIDDRSFLVLERDGKAGAAAGCKQIIRVSIGDNTTDVSGVDQLPATRDLPLGIQPMQKTALLDLLDPAFGLVGPEFPEKVEGLAFGPTLADGRRFLLVCVDNDFVAEQPSWIYAFAIEPERLPGFGWDD